MNIKRKFTSVLAATLIMSTTVGMAASFKDVPKVQWSYDFIDKVSEIGYMTGDGNGKFNPSKSLTFVETMSTLARFMNPTAQERVNANAAYNPLMDELKITDQWKREGITMCLYKGVISEPDLKAFVQAGNLDKPIQKVNNAVFIAKAMGLESAANDLGIVVLPYKDTLDIKEADRKYVDILLKSGILSAEGDGKGYFRPKESLRREIMATMIVQAHEYREKNNIVVDPVGPGNTGNAVVEERVTGDIKRITKDIRTFIVIEDRSGKEGSYSLSNKTDIRIDGRSGLEKDLYEGQSVDMTINKNTNEIINIDVVSLDEKIEGSISQVNASSGSIIISYDVSGRTNSRELKVNTNAKIKLNGAEVKLDKLSKGDMVKVETLSGKIDVIEATSVDLKVDGIIKEIKEDRDNKDNYFITLEVKDQTFTLLVDKDTYVYKDRRRANAKDLKAKDKAYVVGKYDEKLKAYVLDEIESEVSRRRVTGYVESIINRVNQNTVVEIRNIETKKIESYEVARDAVIKVDGKEGALPLNPGYLIDLNLESEQIVVASVESMTLDKSYLGKIDYINTRDNTLEIMLNDRDYISDENNKNEILIVHVVTDKNRSDKTMITKVGGNGVTQIALSDLKRGEYVNVIGQQVGTRFVASRIEQR